MGGLIGNGGSESFLISRISEYMERKEMFFSNVFYAVMLVLALSTTALIGGAVCLLDYAFM